MDLRPMDLRAMDLRAMDLRAMDLRAMDLRAMDLRAMDNGFRLANFGPAIAEQLGHRYHDVAGSPSGAVHPP